ncbi:MAG: sensor histidine kinase [Ilumatobacteraceae bacterium]
MLGGLVNLDPLVGSGIGVLGAVAWMRRRDRVLGATLAAVSISWLAPAVAVGHIGTIFVHRAFLVHAVWLRIPANGRQRSAWGASTSALLSLLYVVNLWLPWADGLAAGSISVALLAVLAAQANRRNLRIAVGAAGVMFAIGIGGRSATLFTATERLTAYDLAAMLVAAMLVLDRLATHHPDQIVEAGRSGRLVAGGAGAPSRLTVGFEDGVGWFRSLSGDRVEPSTDERHFRIDLGTDVGHVLVIHDDAKFDDPVVRTELEPGLRALALNVALARQLQEQGIAAEASRRRVLEADKRAYEAVASDVEIGVVPHLDRISRILESVDLPAEQRAEVTELVSSIRHEVGSLASGDDPLDFGAGLAANLRELAATSRIPVDLVASTDIVDHTACRALYLVASEALTNSAKHSSAGRIKLSLRRDQDTLVLIVEDDGTGGAAIRSGGGIDNARERLQALAGELRVEAAPAGGAKLTARLPCGDPASIG